MKERVFTDTPLVVTISNPPSIPPSTTTPATAPSHSTQLTQYPDLVRPDLVEYEPLPRPPLYFSTPPLVSTLSCGDLSR